MAPTVQLHKWVDPKVVELLEEALAEAKAGQIPAFAMAIVRPNGNINYKHTHQSGRAGAFELVGAVAMLQHGLCCRYQGLDDE